MIILLLLVGGFVGAAVGALFGHGTSGLGFFFGALSGVIFARIQKLRDRLVVLEREVETLRTTRRIDAAIARATTEPKGAPAATVQAAEPPSAADNVLDRVVTDALPPVPRPPSVPPATPDTKVADTPRPIAAAASTRAVFSAQEPALAPAPAPATPRWTPPPREPDSIERGIDAIKRWFTEGNVPVKIGVLVLFAGVAALLKYAADKGWFVVSPEVRLIGVAAAALGGLIFAWRKRESHRLFALSLQGGAIGVLILTVFTAFKLYGLISAGPAFFLLVILVAGTGVLAVLQDALALAVLGIVGGFLAPILVSTDQGNHVALFTYYAILNVAILGIAWIKPWRVLNLVGFVFTFGIGTIWGTRKYNTDLFASTEPFLVLFFVFYLIIPILYALRQPPKRRGFVDGTLVFGMPLLAFPLQAGLLDGDKMELAYSALAVATVYTMLAWLLMRRLSLRLLGESHALLAIGFATLAVPLALSARSTACAWAVEGAALVWLAIRQQRRIPLFLGVLMQLLAGFAMFVHFGNGGVDDLPLLNGDLLGALLISLAGFLSARLLGNAGTSAPWPQMLFVWALGWWVFAGLYEIDRFAPHALKLNWVIGFIAFTGWLGSELYRRFDWRECAWPAAALIPLGVPLLILDAGRSHTLLEDWGALPWGAWVAAALCVLVNLRSLSSQFLSFSHFVFLWIVASLFALQIEDLTRFHWQLVTLWVTLASLTPFAALFWIALQRGALTRWPLDEETAEAHRPWLLGTLATLLGLFWFVGLGAEGRADPLPYLPLVNPLELAQLGFLLFLLIWYRQAEAEGKALIAAETRARMLAVLGFVLLTVITLRGVHFFADVPWSSALFDSTIAQASLSVVWSLAGLGAMLIGARRQSRAVWIAGAVLMGVVLLKLVLIDRRHLGDLPGIVSFLAVGLLLLVVGYFAPVPPKNAAMGDES